MKELIEKYLGEGIKLPRLKEKSYIAKEIQKYTDKNDIKDVASWLNTTIDKLLFNYKVIPLKKLEKQIDEMEGTYSEFSKDEERTQIIYKQYKHGGQIFPIFIEKNDPYLFVMEGRHRMVAMKWMDLKKLPVFFVEKRL